MIKVTITTVMLFASLFACSQTLEETKEWIKLKLETFYFTQPEYPNKLTVSFDDENIIFNQEKTLISKIFTKTTIPIAKMQQIRFSEKTSTIWISFGVKGGNLIREEWLDENGVVYQNELGLIMSKEWSLIMSKEIVTDKLEERLKMAFTDLINGYGGTTKEAY